MQKSNDPYFHFFKTDIKSIEVPRSLNYPFYYQPHEIAKIAAREVQAYLENQNDFDHNFGLDPNHPGMVIGKMFGVLVVKNEQDEIGYISAVSGKLGRSNDHKYFVPPVYNMLNKNSYYLQGEQKIIQLTSKIEELQNSFEFKKLQELIPIEEEVADQIIQQFKREIKENKKKRATLRLQSPSDQLIEELRVESIIEQFQLKDLIHQWKLRKSFTKDALSKMQEEITQLKRLRKDTSSNLQDRLFTDYTFLNANNEEENLLNLFKESLTGKPPAGAGECAAPKLFQYAYKNQLKPIALAEFWWGTPPKSEVKKHASFYPACRGKCEPILTHMLQGLKVDSNPMEVNPAKGKTLPILFEDDAIIVINKPAEFLSVPGKKIKDSVYTRILEMYPNIEGPVIVHRLDMSTSGIMILAKTMKAYHNLQRQFIKRQVKKRYEALLDGVVAEQSGTISLPLRVDLEDRPRQLVCEEHGKAATTNYEIISIRNNQTLVYFYPITGRTHQLRVHAAHHLGLNTPIVGDDLYGTPENRLHLHAGLLELNHPISNDPIKFEIKSEFS